MEQLGLTTKRPRLIVAQAKSANPLYRAYQRNWEFEPMVAEPTLANAIQIGNPVSVNKAIRILKKYSFIDISYQSVIACYAGVINKN